MKAMKIETNRTVMLDYLCGKHMFDMHKALDVILGYPSFQKKSFLYNQKDGCAVESLPTITTIKDQMCNKPSLIVFLFQKRQMPKFFCFAVLNSMFIKKMRIIPSKLVVWF